MKIIYQPQLNSEQNSIVLEIANTLGITFNTAKLLYFRGIDSVSKAKRFLNPGKIWFNNPFLLSGVREAVERLNLAKLRKEKVLIFGDYDADGVSATTLTYFCFEQFGLECLTLIPERADGYGLNIELIKNKIANQNVSLILTVDCGISDCETVDKIKELGIDVIVTDHHIPPEKIPNCICINPKISGQQYPFDKLCGAGVAYKLCRALIGENADKYLDLVALATVADSMDLVEENRDLVFEGLKIFNSKNIKMPFTYLLNSSLKKINSQTLAYQIAPKVNAGGRMGDAKCALDLFLSKNSNEAYERAVKLVEYNIERQSECENIYKNAKEIITSKRLDDYDVIVVSNKEWKVGLIGIVASKLVEDYNKPVIVFAYQNDCFKGSARSLDCIDIFDAINSVSHLTEDFGGHSGAAGVSVKEENISEFREQISSYVKKKLESVCPQKEVFVDLLLDSEFSVDFANEIEMMEPFGVANKKPLFAVKENSVISKPLKEGSAHYFFNTKAVQMLDFNGEHNVYNLSLPTPKTLIFETNVSVFNGKSSLKGYLKKIVNEYENFNDLDLYAFYEQLNSSLELCSDINPNVIPYEKIKIERGVGTLYVLNDANNFYRYDLSILEKYYQIDDSQNCFNKVLFAPLYLPSGYKNVVYLDKPLYSLHTTENVYYADLIGYKSFLELSTDREDMVKCFEKLSCYLGEEFSDIVSFVINHDFDNKKQVIFAYSVFSELGFFEVKNGRLYKNNASKNALTNSTLYCKISNIKG